MEEKIWHRYAIFLGRVLRSWMTSLGICFVSFCCIFLIPGAPWDMPVKYMITLVLLVGTLTTGMVHTLWARH